MSIFLDNQLFVAPTVSEQTTLARLLESARLSLNGTGRLIMTLRVDHRDLTADEISRLLEEPISSFTRLDLLSSDAANLVLQTLENCRTHFAATMADVKATSESLRAGKIPEAMSKLAQAIHVWAQVSEAVQTSGRLLEIDYDILSIGGRRVADAMARFAETLANLKEAIQSRDHVLLGDILQYELDETMRLWEEMLSCIIEHVQGRPSP